VCGPPLTLPISYQDSYKKAGQLDDTLYLTAAVPLIAGLFPLCFWSCSSPANDQAFPGTSLRSSWNTASASAGLPSWRRTAPKQGFAGWKK